jgi:hypothetical protein
VPRHKLGRDEDLGAGHARVGDARANHCRQQEQGEVGKEPGVGDSDKWGAGRTNMGPPGPPAPRARVERGEGKTAPEDGELPGCTHADAFGGTRNFGLRSMMLVALLGRPRNRRR